MTSPLPTDATSAENNAWPQSLSRGAIGIALLAIERAHNGTGTWNAAHAALAAATSRPLNTGDNASLFLGAPAVAFVLHTAAAGTNRYTRTLDLLDAQITDLTRRRLDEAHARIDRGHRPRAAEYDLLYGLTGLGRHLLNRDPDGDTTRAVLSYLVRLTEPLVGDPTGCPAGGCPTAQSTAAPTLSPADTATSAWPTESPAHSPCSPWPNAAAQPSPATPTPSTASAHGSTPGAATTPPVPGGPSGSPRKTSTASSPPSRDRYVPPGATAPPASPAPSSSPPWPPATPTADTWPSTPS